VNKLLLTFYSSLAYGMTRDTYSAVEFTHITEGFNENTLPHTYSNTQQMRMLRMMFVKEEGGELWIAPGTPKAWLDTRDGFSLRKAPTDFGEISYQFRPDPEKKLIHVSIEAGTPAGHPSNVRLRLASNLGVLQSATLNGQAAVLDGDQVVFDGSRLQGNLELEAHYR